MSMNEMEAKCRELRQLQRLIEEAQQEADAIKDAIKAQLTAQGVGEFHAGAYKGVGSLLPAPELTAKRSSRRFPI